MKSQSEADAVNEREDLFPNENDFSLVCEDCFVKIMDFNEPLEYRYTKYIRKNTYGRIEEGYLMTDRRPIEIKSINELKGKQIVCSFGVYYHHASDDDISNIFVMAGYELYICCLDFYIVKA